MRHILPYTLFALFLARSMWGCITPYETILPDNMRSLLVVESIISDGETKVTLSKSIRLTTPGGATGSTLVKGAVVWVENEDGERFEASPQSSEEANKGVYTIPVGELKSETRYRLRISLDGEEYESEFRKPQQTPPIDKLEFYEKNDTQMLQIRLNVKGEADQSHYYLWSYEEIWEVHARLEATHYYGRPGEALGKYYSLNDFMIYSGIQGMEYELDPVFPFYYCWGYDNSKSILVGSSERMKENSLVDHVLYEFGFNSNRISYLYYTKVKQYALAEDAYYYISNQKKNTDETGSIFAPVPSEMRSNVVCTTSPDIPVIGFVEVSRGVEKEEYFKTGLPYTPPPKDWDIKSGSDGRQEIIDNKEANLYFLYMIEDDGYNPPVSYWAKGNGCVDCRQMGGVKKRPSFWPNDHK